VIDEIIPKGFCIDQPSGQGAVIMQFEDTTFIFVYLLLGVVASLLVGRVAIFAANRFGLIDVPGSLPHKKHKLPTPLAGGIVLIVCLLLFTPFAGFYHSPDLSRLIIPLLIIFAFGVWDDKMRIRARYKLLGQCLAALILIYSGVSIQFIESWVGGSSPYISQAFWLDRFITVFWVVGITNAYNLVDSMDGLAIGLANIAFAFFILASINSRQPELVTVFSVLLGIGLGISLLNTTPARLFLGDSGAQSIGFLIATLAILYHPLGKEQASTWFIKAMLMAVPVFDTSLVFFSRIRQKRLFFMAGQDHTYHRLVNLGMAPGRSVAVIKMAAIMMSCLAFIAISLPPLYSNFIFLGTFLSAVIIFFFFEIKLKNTQPEKKI
jgi:UDP-GlcNAc:undecaprenyl-phosphate/decaprenyl-phosphate GlcNAc-1-phosphate transferase